jgi:hypothetical protein
MNSNQDLEKEIEKLKPSWEKVEELKRRLQSESAEMLKFINDMETLLRKNMKYSAEDIASALKIGRSTLFYRLKQLGLAFEDVKKAVMYEFMVEAQRKIKRKEVKHLPPRDFKEFLQREVVQEVHQKMIAGEVTPQHRLRVLSFWYTLCDKFKIAPEDFFDDTRLSEIRDMLVKYLAEEKGNGRVIRAPISLAQALAMWLERPILPAFIKQEEYRGKYQSAELTKDVRELMVSELIGRASKAKNGEIYEITLRSWILAYYTALRAEALTNFTVEGTFKVKWSEFVRVYGTDSFVVIRTAEKGKKGKKFTWRKLVPATWAHLIPKRPLTRYELKKVREITRDILRKIITEKAELFNTDTVKYVMEAGRVLHLWRHTFARDALKAFKWNRYLVSKLGGWIKDSNLQIYGDYDLLSLIEASVEEHRIEFCSEECKKKIEEFL